MNEIQTQIEELKKQFNKDLSEMKDLDELYLKYFSKKQGILTMLLKEMPNMGVEEKKILGPSLNALKNEFETSIEQAKTKRDQDKYNDPMMDMSFPLKEEKIGRLHPTTQVIREMNEFFRYYGFSIIDGPEIETEEYNFRKLNLPEGHPATDLQDTLYISEHNGILLRTHTSSIESRILTNQKPPIRAVVGNRCYRNETLSATNGAFFWQYQGVVVDKGITIQNLKATLELFHKFLFGDDVKLRFRYKYYPEVSPGMGVDMQCRFCAGEGCDVCKHRGWIEVLGSGMIHYNTLKMCGIDPEVYTGYAFGMGLDRLVMQKFGIKDIRKLYGGGLVYN